MQQQQQNGSFGFFCFATGLGSMTNSMPVATTLGIPLVAKSRVCIRFHSNSGDGKKEPEKEVALFVYGHHLMWYYIATQPSPYRHCHQQTIATTGRNSNGKGYKQKEKKNGSFALPTHLFVSVIYINPY